MTILIPNKDRWEDWQAPVRLHFSIDSKFCPWCDCPAQHTDWCGTCTQCGLPWEITHWHDFHYDLAEARLSEPRKRFRRRRADTR